MNKNLLKKFMEYGIGSILTLLLGFITSPIITRLISPEQNGKFTMFTTVTNLLMVISMLGVDQSYVRYYYEEEKENRGTLLRTCIKIPIIINLLVAIFIIISYNYVSLYIVEERSLVVSILLIINIFLCIISRFSMLQVRMQQRGKLYSLLNIITKLTNLIFVILIFYIYENNYITLILAQIFTNTIVTLLAIYLERKEWSSKSIGRLKTSKDKIIRYGFPLVFSMAITWIFQSIDRIAIKEFAGYAEVGLYSGAMTIIALLNAVQSTFTTFWTPVAFERYTNNPNDKEFFSYMNRTITIFMLFIAIGIIVCKDLIVLLLGPQYRDAVFVFPYLVFMPIMFTISETTVIGINFKSKSVYHINIAIISAITNLIGNIILVPKIGAIGAAISTGLSYIVFFVIRTYYSVKLYKVNYSLGKFAISIILVYVLATYSSFYKFNFTVLLIAVLNIIVISILYKETILELIFKLKK